MRPISETKAWKMFKKRFKDLTKEEQTEYNTKLKQETRHHSRAIAYQRKYYRKNKAHCLDYGHTYYQMHKDERLAYARRKKLGLLSLLLIPMICLTGCSLNENTAQDEYLPQIANSLESLVNKENEISIDDIIISQTQKSSDDLNYCFKFMNGEWTDLERFEIDGSVIYLYCDNNTIIITDISNIIIKTK